MEEIINEVLKGIDNSWPTLYKIRYVYLAVGKILSRDTDFFFSVDGKLGEANLSVEEIKKIYESDTGHDYKVICKSASFILKAVYDKLGIKSKLVETNTSIATVGDDDFLINHWLLVAYDDENKAYFMTLTPDLPYIKMNMETRHFGSDIPYERDYSGKKFRVYKGEEIKATTIPKDKLKQIDIDINYIKEQYLTSNRMHKVWHYDYEDASLSLLKEQLSNNSLFYEIEEGKTDFYNDLMKFRGHNGKKIDLYDCSLFSLNEKDKVIWLKIICRNVLDKIENYFGYSFNVVPPIDSNYWNFDSWLLNFCVLLEDDIYKSFERDDVDVSSIKINIENFQYSKWSKKVKNAFGITSTSFNYNNILVILDKLNALVNCVKNNGKNGHLSQLISSLAYHFIDPNHLYEFSINENGYLANYYIANKFECLFKHIFSSNDMISPLNKMDYSEQVVIIKEIIASMFPEVNYENSKFLVDYNDEYSAIANRIQIYPIKSKKTGEYSIIFNIIGDNKIGDYYFYYNLLTNEFKAVDVLSIYNDFIIVSNRMKRRMSIEDLENIDIGGRKK